MAEEWEVQDVRGVDAELLSLNLAIEERGGAAEREGGREAFCSKNTTLSVQLKVSFFTFINQLWPFVLFKEIFV